MDDGTHHSGAALKFRGSIPLRLFAAPPILPGHTPCSAAGALRTQPKPAAVCTGLCRE